MKCGRRRFDAAPGAPGRRSAGRRVRHRRRPLLAGWPGSPCPYPAAGWGRRRPWRLAGVAWSGCAPPRYPPPATPRSRRAPAYPRGSAGRRHGRPECSWWTAYRGPRYESRDRRAAGVGREAPSGRSGRQFRPALAPPRCEDRTPGPCRHAVPEPVLARAATIVGLEGALAHDALRCSQRGSAVVLSSFPMHVDRGRSCRRVPGPTAWLTERARPTWCRTATRCRRGADDRRPP